MLNWESLQTACLSCTSCPLSQTRHNVVFGVGPQDAEVMFVGEGPGENEDLQGEPFVGAAGKFLDEMLSIIDLGRENCYITNIVKCRPPRNRDPMQTEQDACIGFLRAQTKAHPAEDHRLPWPHRGHAPHPSGFQDLLRTRTVHRKGRHPLHRTLSPLRPPARRNQAPRTPFQISRPSNPKSARSAQEPYNRQGRAAGRVLPALRRGSAQGFPSGNWLRSEAEQTDEGRQQPRFASDYQNFVHIIHLK